MIELNFQAHGRHFGLRLKRDLDSTNNVFHPEMVIEDSDGRPVDVGLDHLVTGELHGQPNSYVYGSISDGIFEGKIHTNDSKTFFVEKAQRYMPSDSLAYQLIDAQDQEQLKKSRYSLIDLVTKRPLLSQASPTAEHYRRIMPFHSIIYSSDHVVDPYAKQRSSLGKSFFIWFHLKVSCHVQS